MAIDRDSPTPRALARSAGFAGLFLVAVLLGRQTVMDGTSLSLVWPAAGVAALWFSVQRDAETWPLDLALLGGITLLVNVVTGATPLLAMFFVVANVLQVVLFQWLLERWCPRLWGAGGQEALTGIRPLSRLLAAAALSTLPGALIGPAGVWVTTGHWSWLITTVWLTRNSVSIVLIVTVGMRVGILFAQRGTTGPGRLAFQRPVRWHLAELVVLVAGSVVIYAVVFWWTGLPLAFFTIPLTVWVALRFDTTVVVVHDLVAGSAAVMLTLAGHGPFAAVGDDAMRALTVQAFVGLLAVIGLTLALSRDEREVLLGQVRHQAAVAAQHARHLEVLAEVSRELVDAPDARETVCSAARRISGADGAYLLEAVDGFLVGTTMVGVDLPPVRIDLSAERSMSAESMQSRELRFVADVVGHPGISQRVVDELRLRSAAWQPIVAPGGAPLGVIGLAFRTPLAALPVHVPSMLATLAGEAAGAMERADLLAKLAEAAERDALTGIPNRRRWDEIAAAEIARAERSGRPLTFALVDLDHFKRYNDTRGHLAGDGLIRAFAEAASGCLRDVDAIARWGGEEFALALPDCTAPDALAVAERIRGSVPDGQTCTVGLAEWHPGQSAAEVLAQADIALYDGKHSGRDVVRISPGVPQVGAVG